MESEAVQLWASGTDVAIVFRVESEALGTVERAVLNTLFPTAQFICEMSSQLGFVSWPAVSRSDCGPSSANVIGCLLGLSAAVLFETAA